MSVDELVCMAAVFSKLFPLRKEAYIAKIITNKYEYRISIPTRKQITAWLLWFCDQHKHTDMKPSDT